MSAPICYIERSARGDAIERVRLTGERLDEAWTPEGDLRALDRPKAAAAWISQTLVNHADRALALVCLDASGSFASWIRPATRDAKIVETMIRQSEGEALVGIAGDASSFEDGSAAEGLVGSDLASPGGGAFQVLLDDESVDDLTTRATVLAVREPAVGLLLDELDTLGVQVHAVNSIWQLLGSAWDPAAPLNQHAGNTDIVASDAPISAVCLVDSEGRLVWSWTRGARVLAAGQMRVAMRDGSPELRDGSLARLSADWLAWSSQVGAAPRRVVFVAQRAAEGAPCATQSIARAISRALPDATTDLALVDDPIGETCRRLVGYRGEVIGTPDDPARSLVSLSRRPGRAHRGMYRWLSAALIALASLSGFTASKLFTRASVLREDSRALRAEQLRVYLSENPEPASGTKAIDNLEAMIANEHDKQNAGQQIKPPKAIMEELDTILFVLSLFYDRGLELESIALTGSILRNLVVVTVGETSVYEDLIASLANTSSAIDWTDEQKTQGDRIRVTLRGRWR